MQILRFLGLAVLQLILGVRNIIFLFIKVLALMRLRTLNEVLVVLHPRRVWWRHELVLVFLYLTETELAFVVADQLICPFLLVC